MAASKCKVDFEPLGNRVEVEPGATLLDAARKAGLPLTSECGGAGSCGQCTVIVRDQPGSLGMPGLTEQTMLTDDELASGRRMACQADIFRDVKVDVPASSLIRSQRLQVDSGLSASPGVPDPAAATSADLIIQPVLVSVPPATLHDLRSDLNRILDVLATDHHLSGLAASPAAVRALPALLRRHNWQVNAILRGHEIIAFLAPGVRPLGLAVDLGTTKLAAYLVDMLSGQTLASEGRPNPQIGYGEDVISRLGYANGKPGGGQVLARAVHATLGELASLLAARVDAAIDQIVEVCVVGNTAMTHLLLELPGQQLALAPYVPAAATHLEVRAADFNLPLAGDARIYIPPCVAGYVGADLVAMALASRIGQDDRSVLGIDIGTNTEIILSKRGSRRMLALSCASGPAFEGAHIRSGMRAAAGAIERVWLDGARAIVQTIDAAPAVGICGSGIIDAVAELHRTGAINSRGRFQAGMPGVRPGRNGLEYLLVAARDSGSGEDILITQNDIDEIQYAKGAIMAGITVLLQSAGLQADDLDEIIVAGAFGTYLNLDTAISMGLLPSLPLDRYRQVGNAAGEGARLILQSRTERTRADDLVARIDYVELTVFPGFRSIYAKAMRLNTGDLWNPNAPS